MTTATIHRNTGFVEGVGRLRLFYRTWEVEHPRAAVLIVHGLGEHSGRYADFAESLALSRYTCFALDLRGHGQSEGRRGHVHRFGTFLQDFERFRREAQGLLRPGCPLFLLGHSMGGLVALRYLQEYEGGFTGAILVSPWLATAVPIARWKIAVGRVLNPLFPSLPLSSGIRAEDLSHDPAVVKAYRDDALVQDRVTPRLFSEASAEMGLAIQRADRVRCPILLLLAGDDRVTDTDRAVAFASLLPSDGVSLRVYPGYYHEVLNETDRNLVRADLREWLDAQLG